MANKQRKGIDLMKKISDKQAADMQLLRQDADKRLKKSHKRPAM